jgi:hypothetical protein
MADDEQTPSPPMKPQDTVIYLLGEIKGKVGSLQASVDSNSRAQADVNKANEEEHTKFRDAIATLSTAVAVLNDSRTSQRYSMSERTQRWMVWAGVPGMGLAVVTLFFMFYNK